jgi:hypothetical protein
MTVDRSHVGKSAGVLLALFFAIHPLRARAQSPAPLVLEVPCITQAELEARVQPLLPAAATAPNALQGVQVRMRTLETEQEAEIVLPARADQPAVTRTLRGESCETVVDAAILVLGLWVSETAAPPPPVVPPAPAAPPPAVKPTTQAEDDGKGERLQWSALLGGAVGNAILPSTSLGIELAGVVSWRTLRVSLGGRWWPAQSKGPSSTQVEASLMEGELLVAWLPLSFVGIELGPAVGLTQGQLRVAGVGVDDARQRAVVWFRTELAAHARYRWPSSPVAVWVIGGGALPWSRPRVEIGGEGTVFRPAALSPYGALGVELVL